MELLPNLFEKNRQWAASKDPAFFEELSSNQNPDYFWIGCADSRVPANQIVGLEPGELFVHRNVANVVIHTDLNCLSALQYAVEALEVKHVIVCGHYGCGGVRAAAGQQQLGLIDNWLRNIKDVYHIHREELEVLEEEARVDRLCELNVVNNVANVCATTIVQNAWASGQKVAVHGWIYHLTDGLLRDLDITVTSNEQVPAVYRLAHEAPAHIVTRGIEDDPPSCK